MFKDDVPSSYMISFCCQIICLFVKTACGRRKKKIKIYQREIQKKEWINKVNLSHDAQVDLQQSKTVLMVDTISRGNSFLLIVINLPKAQCILVYVPVDLSVLTTPILLQIQDVLANTHPICFAHHPSYIQRIFEMIQWISIYTV